MFLVHLVQFLTQVINHTKTQKFPKARYRAVFISLAPASAMLERIHFTVVQHLLLKLNC